jgi:CheY-specific phosphatase CheX
MDGWGEIVNILAGAADAKINEIKIDLSLPSVVLGRNARFYAKAGNPFVIVPLYIPDVGPLNLGISMELNKK